MWKSSEGQDFFACCLMTDTAHVNDNAKSSTASSAFQYITHYGKILKVTLIPSQTTSKANTNVIAKSTVVSYMLPYVVLSVT
jgi:hypothetical protein